MNTESWAILAAALIWALLLLTLASILLRALRFRRPHQMPPHPAPVPSETLPHPIQITQYPAPPPHNPHRLHPGLDHHRISLYAPLSIRGHPTSTNTIQTDATCVICLDDIDPGTRQRILPCMHVFHDHCIYSWLLRSDKCPSCMTSLRPKLPAPGLGDLRSFYEASIPPETPQSPSQQSSRRFLGLWTFASRGTAEPPTVQTAPVHGMHHVVEAHMLSEGLVPRQDADGRIGGNPWTGVSTRFVVPVRRANGAEGQNVVEIVTSGRRRLPRSAEVHNLVEIVDRVRRAGERENAAANGGV